jgi:DNA-binding IclR family transcriptional regulator
MPSNGGGTIRNGMLRRAPLERYVSVLEAIAIAPEQLSLSQIAERCGLPPGTSHRIVGTLLKTGLIQPSNSKRRDYVLGDRLLRLLHFGSDTAYIRIMVQPLLDRLADRLGHTCFLVRLSADGTITSMAWAVPERGIRGFVVPGHVMPPHASASAKAILAFQHRRLIKSVLSGPLPKLAPSTLTDPVRVLDEYASVRQRGYATCWDEWEQDLGAIACPIRTPRVGVIYSIGTSALIKRLKDRPIGETVDILQEAADTLAQQLPAISSKGA